MTNRDWGMIFLLLTLALFIWIQDISWISDFADTLPIIASLPLFVWLGWPWRFIHGTWSLSYSGLLFSTIGFFLGSIFGSFFFFALGWSLLLWSWLSARVEPEKRQSVKQLMILPLLAFPWIMLEGEMIGWWFRLSGTWAASTLYSLLGYKVVQGGTSLLVQGLPIDVSAACAGLNTLQSMLIAGSCIAYTIIGNYPAYWLNLIFLVIFSWIANTLRIIAICWAAVAVSPEFAAGIFHKWGGWLVLFLMFTLCCLMFTLEKSLFQNSEKSVKEQ